MLRLAPMVGWIGLGGCSAGSGSASDPTQSEDRGGGRAWLAVAVRCRMSALFLCCIWSGCVEDPGPGAAPDPTQSEDNGGEQIGEDGTPVDPHAGGVHVLTGAEALSGAPGRAVILGPLDCGYQLTAPGDVDGDGVPDLGVGCSDGILRVLSGAALLSGAGTELARVHLLYDFDEPAPLGDLDGDGIGEIGVQAAFPARLEWGLVLPGVALAGEVWVGPASWRLLTDGVRSAVLRPVAAGDVDGDGVPDVAVAGANGDGRLVVVSGARIAAAAPGDGVDIGDGPLVDLVWPEALGEIRRVTPLGDVNGDGRSDLAVAAVPRGHVAPVVRILWGGALSAAGLPELTVAQTGTEGEAEAAALGDLDGDGLAEVAVRLHTSGTADDRGERLAVVPGRDVPPSGALDVGPYLLTESAGSWLTACDLDADGLPELVTGAGIWSGADLLTPGAQPAARGTGRSVCLGDLDGDGTSELAVGDPQLGRLR